MAKVRKTFVIEHMEPEEQKAQVAEWVLLEYSKIIRTVAPDMDVIFSNLSEALLRELECQLASVKPTLPAVYTFTSDSVSTTLISNPSKVVLLDPQGPSELVPDDFEAHTHFVFGGILGDDPPRDRTSALRHFGFHGRHLGPDQMTTDTAVHVTKIVLEGKRLEEIEYVNHPEIYFGPGESVIMPFKYVQSFNNEPILPLGMKELLKADMDKDLLDEF